MAEVIAEDRQKLVNEIEQKWTDDQKAAIRKEVEDEYDMMLSQMENGRG